MKKTVVYVAMSSGSELPLAVGGEAHCYEEIGRSLLAPGGTEYKYWIETEEA